MSDAEFFIELAKRFILCYHVFEKLNKGSKIEAMEITDNNLTAIEKKQDATLQAILSLVTVIKDSKTLPTIEPRDVEDLMQVNELQKQIIMEFLTFDIFTDKQKMQIADSLMNLPQWRRMESLQKTISERQKKRSVLRANNVSDLINNEEGNE